MIVLVFLISCQQDMSNSDEVLNNAAFAESDSSRFETVLLENEKLDQCLPQPTDLFLKLKSKNELYNYFPSNEKDFLFDDVYYYLYFSADSMAAKQVLKQDDFGGSVHWKQEFVNGITYEKIRYVEAGAKGRLYSKCTNNKNS